MNRWMQITWRIAYLKQNIGNTRQVGAGSPEAVESHSESDSDGREKIISKGNTWNKMKPSN